MAMTRFINRYALAVGTIGLLSAGNFTVATPAHAASVDFSSWTIIGDGVSSPSQATLSNAFIGTPADPDGATFNLSGRNPLSVFGVGPTNFETAIGLTPGALNPALGIGPQSTPVNLGYREGSAIRNSSFTADTGDVFSFDWSFLQKDDIDLGFVRIGNTISRLNAGAGVSNFFTYTFDASGTYDIAIGVIDVNDFTFSSQLQLRNGQLSPIPTPALLPGLIGFAYAALRQRKQSL